MTDINNSALVVHSLPLSGSLLGGVNHGAGLGGKEDVNKNATDKEMESQLKALGELLSELQITIAKFAKVSETNHYKINSGYLVAAQKQVHKAIKALHQEQQEKVDQAHESFWKKLEGIVMTVLSCVVAAVTQQWELVAVTLAFTVMQYSGGTKDLEKVLTTALEKMGLSGDAARFLSDIAILVASVVIAHKVSGAVLGEAEAASTAIKTGTDEVVEDEGTLSKLKAKIKGISRRGATDMLAGSQAVMSTNFATDLSKVAHLAGLRIALEVLVELIAIVAGGVGSVNLMSRAGSKVADVSSFLQKVKSGAFGAAYTATLVDTGAQAANGILSGITDLSLANTTFALINAKAETNLFNGLMKELDSGFSGWMQTVSSQERNESVAIGSLGQAYAGVNGTVAHELAV